MIDWNSESWGNRVHMSDTGSWLPERHDDATRTGIVDGPEA